MMRPHAPVAARQRLWRETWLAVRFGVVGICATLLHMGGAAALLLRFGTPPLLANTVAFLVAFCLSFAGHYFWTFRTPGDAARAVRRFFAIAASAFLVNTLVLGALLQSGILQPLVALLLSVAVMPVITYLASRLWGFRTSRTASGRNS